MTHESNADLQRWSEEVARDPGSLSFLPLARAYRRHGQRELAIEVCMRGLTLNPTHVEGHELLALLYLEGGDHQSASDEWATILRLDPDNFEAHRGLGFYRLEKGDLEAARRHLDRAAALRPGDPTVRDALALLHRQVEEGANVAVQPEAAPSASKDPHRIFDPLLDEPAFLGALVLDEKGLIRAGALRSGGADRGVEFGANLGKSVEDAVRTVEHLKLGLLRSVLLDTERATLYLAPLGKGHTILVVVERGSSSEWVRRAAVRAAELARDHLGSSS